MAKAATRRDDLRGRLIAAATRRIAAHGLPALRARDLAQDAGCALGALYTVFADLDALVLDVAAGTLDKIDSAMEAATQGEGDAGRLLRKLGETYLAFARDNPFLWRALFVYTMPEGRALPEGFATRLLRLLRRIEEPVGRLQPALAGEALAVRARTLFAAVHGVVLVSLDNRFVGLPAATLDAELDRFISLLLAGLAAVNG